MLDELKRALRRWQQHRRTRALRDAHVGPGSFVDPSVQILGWERVRLGRNVVVGEHTWLNVNDRGQSGIAIDLGDHSFIGRRNFFNAGALIQIGPYCLTGVDCHFLGSDHRHDTPFAPYIATGNETHQRIVVGANCWFGTSVTVLGDIEIGHGSILGAAAVVTANVPPFSMAVGNPARVIKRFDLARNAWVPFAEWSPAAEAQIPSAGEYLARLVQSHPRIKLPRIASGQRHGDL